MQFSASFYAISIQLFCFFFFATAMRNAIPEQVEKQDQQILQEMLIRPQTLILYYQVKESKVVFNFEPFPIPVLLFQCMSTNIICLKNMVAGKQNWKCLILQNALSNPSSIDCQSQIGLFKLLKEQITTEQLVANVLMCIVLGLAVSFKILLLILSS